MNRTLMTFLCGVVLLGFVMLGLRQTKGQVDWSNSPNREWYEKQMPTPETLKEYNIMWQSCCAHGDVCQTCVVYRFTDKPPWNEGFWYTNGGIAKKLPEHIVEVVPWTPTGKPVLFLAPVNSGKMKAGDPVCLKVVGGGT